MTEKTVTQSIGTMIIKPPSEAEINNIGKWNTVQEVLVKSYLNGESEIDFTELVKRVEKLKVERGEL